MAGAFFSIRSKMMSISSGSPSFFGESLRKSRTDACSSDSNNSCSNSLSISVVSGFTVGIRFRVRKCNGLSLDCQGRLTGVGFLIEEVFVPNDPGLFFDFGVRLPTPTSGSSTFLFADFDPWFHMNPDHPQKGFPPRWLSNVFGVDDFRGLFRLEKEFPHRNSQTEVPAATTARCPVFRRFDRMPAGFTNMPVLPRSIAVTHFLHNGKYNILRAKGEDSYCNPWKRKYH